jgi:hypothetical protein
MFFLNALPKWVFVGVIKFIKLKFNYLLQHFVKVKLYFVMFYLKGIFYNNISEMFSNIIELKAIFVERWVSYSCCRHKMTLFRGQAS